MSPTPANGSASLYSILPNQESWCLIKQLSDFNKIGADDNQIISGNYGNGDVFTASFAFDETREK